MDTVFLLIITALFFGLRHGIDWDHIAAITDLTGASQTFQKGFLQANLYVIGHALVIVILGLSAILIGAKLPNSIDKFMEPVVGLTLLGLGLVLLLSITIKRKTINNFSRGVLLFNLIINLYNRVHKKFSPHHHDKHSIKSISGKSAFIIGLLHGIGAETPTQVTLFAATAGAKSPLDGILALGAFVIGLMVSNTTITVLSIMGFNKFSKNANVSLVLGSITSVFSIFLGLLFLFNREGLLPAIF